MLGIVERWKRESNEALKKLEELTGQTWENPYKPENERFTLKLTDEERTTITNRINDGYYRPEAVQARKDEEKRKAYEKKRAEIINDCKKKQQKAENEKRVMLAVLDAGLSVNNVIYYDHSNELVFNWKDYETKVTENDFNKFVSSVNRSLLPAGITFKMICKEFGGEFEREANKKKHSFKLDFNIAFGEYKDGLCKDGIISQSLYERATLY